MAEAVSFDVETGNPLRIMTNASEHATLVFGNPSDGVLAAKAVVKGVDFFGQSLSRDISLSLASGGVQRVEFGPFPMNIQNGT